MFMNKCQSIIIIIKNSDGLSMRVEHNDLCIPPHHVFVNINSHEPIIPSRP